MSGTASVDDGGGARRSPVDARRGRGGVVIPDEAGMGRPRRAWRRRLPLNPIGGVATDDQHLGGGVGTDAQALTQRRRSGGESTPVTVVVHADGEREPATGERPEGRADPPRVDRADVRPHHLW